MTNLLCPLIGHASCFADMRDSDLLMWQVLGSATGRLGTQIDTPAATIKARAPSHPALAPPHQKGEKRKDGFCSKKATTKRHEMQMVGEGQCSPGDAQRNAVVQSRPWRRPDSVFLPSCYATWTPLVHPQRRTMHYCCEQQKIKSIGQGGCALLPLDLDAASER